MIEFAQPVYFALAAVVLAMAAGAWFIARWRGRARSEFAGPQASQWPGSGFWPRVILVLVAAGLLVLAAARPQWGTVERFRERQGIDYVIVLDISQSMLAEDVAPNRLALAQEELIRLVESEPDSRVGLVLFAGTAFLRSPLTTDTQAIAQLIGRADQEAGLTRVGSDIGAALDVAGVILAASEPDRGRAVLLVSDGEDHAGTFEASAAALSEQGITVLTAGVGTPQGIQLFDSAGGEREPKLDADGVPVISRLEESNLQAIADIGGGDYRDISAGDRSLLGLRADLRGLDPTPLGAERNLIPVERYQLFVAAAMILLVASWFLPARVPLPRLRRLRPQPAFALLLALLIGACGGDEDPLRVRNEEANALFEAGDFAGALAIYQELLAERPDVDQLHYNAGNALHRLQEYERAIDAVRRALPPREPDLGADVYYALGNHLLQAGNVEQAYAAYRSALLIDPADADTKHNLEIALLLLAPQQPDDAQPGPGDQGQTGDGQPQEGGTPMPGEQPEPGEGGEPQDSPQAGSPEPAGDASGPPGTPEGTPAEGASVQRSLAEALAGLDEDVSFEEAIEVLDLLRQLQQTPRPLPGDSPQGPDY